MPLLIERRPSAVPTDDLLHPDLGPDGRVRLAPGEVLRWHGVVTVRELRVPAGRRRGREIVRAWTLVPAATLVITNRRVAYVGSGVQWAGSGGVAGSPGAVFAGHVRFQWLQTISVTLRQSDGITVAVMLLDCLTGDGHVVITVRFEPSGGLSAESLATGLGAALADDVGRFRVEIQGADGRAVPVHTTSPGTWEWDLPGSLPVGSRPGPPPPEVPGHLAPAIKALLEPLATQASPTVLRRAVDRHPVLLSVEVDELFGAMIESARLGLDPAKVHMMFGIRAMLRRWREAGPDAAMDVLVRTVLAVDPANRAVWGFQLLIQSDSSAEALATLTQFPELLAQQGLDRVDAFIREWAGDDPQVDAVVTKYRRLLDRCRRIGAQAAVAEFDVQAGLPDDLVAARVGADRADGHDLDEVVRLRTVVLNHPALPTEQYPEAARDAARAHWRRFEQRGGVDDLGATIELCRSALLRLTPGVQQRVEIESNLAVATMARYSRTGDLSDLEDAVRVLRGVDASRRDATTAANLGAALVELFRRSERSPDLADGIAAHELAVSLTPASSQFWPQCTFGLAQALVLQHREFDGAWDLQRGIQLLQSIVDRVPAGAPDLPMFLDGLGGALLAAGRLDEAVTTSERAVALLPPGSPRRASILNAAAQAHAARYRDNRDPSDLDVAASLWREGCRVGVETAPEAVLVAAGNWSATALAAGRWAETVEAADAGLAMTGHLVRIQPQRRHREVWLRQTRQLAASGAYGAARLADPCGAATLLERGRTLLLADAFADVERTLLELQVAGHGHIADRYRQAATALANLNAMPGPRVHDLRQARLALDEAIAAVQRIDGFAAFLRPPTYTDLAAAALGRTIVYLAATERGGVAVIIDGHTRQQPVPHEPTASVQWLDHLTDHAVVGLTDQLLTAYTRRAADHDGWVASLDATTKALWDMVLAPLQEILPPQTRITIVPGGLLGLLPLHAAWTPDTSTPTGRRYALDDYLITYAPNGRSLRAVDASAPASLLGIDTDLPNGRAEVDAVSRTFAKVLTLHGDDASRERVLPLLQQFAVLHFACHGAMDPFQPLEGGLQLAGGKRLTLRDILAQPRLTARLAVLSACETAVAGAELPDEAFSLPTGLLQAGVTAVIGSFWAVPDLDTARLMIHCYEQWATMPADPAQALRQAQRWLRDETYHDSPRHRRDLAPLRSDNAHSHIEHWAAFAYYGS